MNSPYHVTFYYNATGMEGIPDTRDFGVYYATSKDGAERLALQEHFPKDRADWDWIQGCMTAKEVRG